MSRGIGNNKLTLRGCKVTISYIKVTQDYADSIGADLYAADALEAVVKIKQLLAK